MSETVETFEITEAGSAPIFTFATAAWADENQTSAAVICDQLGEVTVGAENGGQVWADFQLAVEGGLEVGDYVIPQPTTQDVNAERERRIRAGFVFNGKLYDYNMDAKTNISGAAQMAFMFIVVNGAQPGNYRWNGRPDDFSWIAKDNTLTQMDAPTVVQFGKRAAEHETHHRFKARSLKDMNPIPSDYQLDSYWS